jgi:hypothetical protein
MANRVTLWERVIKPWEGAFSPEHARYILGLGFTPQEKARYEELAYKNQGPDISAEERRELEEFVDVNTLLMLLKSKARLSLKNQASPV